MLAWPRWSRSLLSCVVAAAGKIEGLVAGGTVHEPELHRVSAAFAYDVYDAEPEVVYRDAAPALAVESKVVGVLVVGLPSVAAAAADDDLLFVVTVAVPAAAGLLAVPVVVFAAVQLAAGRKDEVPTTASGVNYSDVQYQQPPAVVKLLTDWRRPWKREWIMHPARCELHHRPKV
jgi:hypothetical protein